MQYSAYEDPNTVVCTISNHPHNYQLYVTWNYDCFCPCSLVLVWYDHVVRIFVIELPYAHELISVNELTYCVPFQH